MKSFDISINNIDLKSDDINKFLNRGQSHKAVDFIIEQSQCSRIEADEIVEDLKRLRIENRNQTIGNWNQAKEAQSTYVDSTERQPTKQTAQSTPKCPTCGSTNISRISGTERAASVLGLGIMSKKINKTFKCNNPKCKYTW